MPCEYLFYHINCCVIQGFPALRKAVTTQVKKYRIFSRVLMHTAPLGQVDESWTRSLMGVTTQLNFFINLHKFIRICINPEGFIRRKFCSLDFFFWFGYKEGKGRLNLINTSTKIAQVLKKLLPYMKYYAPDGVQCKVYTTMNAIARQINVYNLE